MSKCPSCENSYSSLAMEKQTAKKGHDSLPVVVFNCPSCGATVGVQVDPHKFIEEIKRQLRR